MPFILAVFVKMKSSKSPFFCMKKKENWRNTPVKSWAKRGHAKNNHKIIHGNMVTFSFDNIDHPSRFPVQHYIFK